MHTYMYRFGIPTSRRGSANPTLGHGSQHRGLASVATAAAAAARDGGRGWNAMDLRAAKVRFRPVRGSRKGATDFREGFFPDREGFFQSKYRKRSVLCVFFLFFFGRTKGWSFRQPSSGKSSVVRLIVAALDEAFYDRGFPCTSPLIAL